MKVRDAMAKTIATAQPSTTIKEVAVMMRREDCGFIPVLRGDHLEGVVTDRDIVVRFCADGAPEASMITTPISEIMTTTPIAIRADANLEDAGHLMAEHQVRRLVVLDGARVVGILSFGNLEQAVHAHGACAEEVTLGVTSGA
jgi:CBS domain-containing protein